MLVAGLLEYRQQPNEAEIYLDGEKIVVNQPYRKISAVKCTFEATDIGPEGVE